MRKTLCFLIAAAILASSPGCGGAETVFKNETSSSYAPQILELIKREESALRSGDKQGYISCFSPEKRSNPLFGPAIDYEFKDPRKYQVFVGTVRLQNVTEENGNVLQAKFYIDGGGLIRDRTVELVVKNGKIYDTRIISENCRPKK